MTNALEIKDLRKIYATGVEALKGIDLVVEEGQMVPENQRRSELSPL